MKISWGYKIAGVYLLFVVGMLYLVYRANKESNDLVIEDYYGAELKYQNVIDQKDRVAHLSAPPQVTTLGNKLVIQLPAEFNGKVTTGELYLYCPADKRNDLRRNFSITEGAFSLQLPATIKGLFEVKLSWAAGGKTYYHEQKEFFQP
jgi:hypothetical protein